MGRMEFRPPVSLMGGRVALLPLDRAHSEALWRASRDPEVGRYMLLGPGETRPEFDEMITTVLGRQASGVDLAFTTTRLPDRTPIGMTRFMEIDRDNGAVEIGGSWLDPVYWGSPVNTEAKWLMFRHAFEVEGAHRVWLRTDARNVRSQRAIAALGAIREAEMREHLKRRDGFYRSSIYFSVLAGEWPEVRARLEAKFRQPWTAPARGTP